jgi:hypothetical protein
MDNIKMDLEEGCGMGWTILAQTLVSVVFNLGAPQNAGPFSRSLTTGGVWSSAQLLRVSYSCNTDCKYFV